MLLNEQSAQGSFMSTTFYTYLVVGGLPEIFNVCNREHSSAVQRGRVCEVHCKCPGK